MNIVYLRYATVIAKAGSLSKAAEELFVAQPNLSRAIKELEKELDITIFERTSKGIVLTPDGERLIENGKKILRQIDELEKEFTATSTKRRGSRFPRRGRVISHARLRLFRVLCRI